MDCGLLLALDDTMFASKDELLVKVLLAPLEFNSLIPDALESCKVADFLFGDITC